MSEYYCYTHTLPTGEVFYVGKGTGRRASNFRERNARHKAFVEPYGKDNIGVTIYPADSEEQALGMEKFLMSLLDKNTLVNGTDDGGVGTRPKKGSKVELALKLVEQGITRNAAAKMVGITPSAVYVASLKTRSIGRY